MPSCPLHHLPHLLLSGGLLLALLLTQACKPSEELPRLDLDRLASSEEIDQAVADRKREGYTVAFDVRISPLEDARQYLPLIQYLEQETGLPFRLDLRTSADALEQGYLKGEIDFAILGAGSYLSLFDQSPIQPLVRGLNAEGEPGYRSYLVTLPDSPLQGISSLRGRRLAFGSRTSTQGYLIPRIMLNQAGLSLDDLAGYEFTGSHRACAETVIRQKADACGLQDTLARQLVDAGQLRVLAISEVFPSSGIFAHPRVPQTVRSAVRGALLAFDPVAMKDRLYHWEQTEMAGGFTTASAADYEVLRRWRDRLEASRSSDRDLLRHWRQLYGDESGRDGGKP